MTQPTGAQGGPRYRVLLVDDDPTMLRLMSGLLGTEMDVTTATSPLHALRLLEQRTFDVVCTDYRMPSMNGVDLLRAAAQLQEEASLLLVTAAAEQVPGDERRQYFVVVKPFDAERLVRLVEQLGRVAQMKRSVKAGVPSRPQPPAERESWPPPSSRHRAPPSERESRPPPSSRHAERQAAPLSERRPSPLSDRRSLPPNSAHPPRSSGGGGRK